MWLHEFLKSVIANYSDEEAVAYEKERIVAAEGYARTHSEETENEREKLLNAILDCVADVAKPSSVIATELNISPRQALTYCRILENGKLVIVTIGESPVNSKQNVKYFKKA